jgi:hypothetical protein
MAARSSAVNPSVAVVFVVMSIVLLSLRPDLLTNGEGVV